MENLFVFNEDGKIIDLIDDSYILGGLKWK